MHLVTTALGRAVSLPLKIVAARKPILKLHIQSLPVGGVDVVTAQAVLYWLRKSLSADQGPELVEAWLGALQLAQIASDRLLHALQATQRSLRFWRGRLEAGSHSSFMLLARGPAGFLTDTLSALRLAQCGEPHVSPSDRIAERIAALQLLSDSLAEALASVHNTAALLSLAGVMQDTAAAAAAAAAGSNPQQQQATLNGAATAVAAAVSDCLAAMTKVLQKLLPDAARLQQHDVAARQLQQGTPASSFVQRAQSKQQQQQQQHARDGAATAPAGTTNGSSSTMRSVSLKQLHQQINDCRGLLGLQGKQSLRQCDARSLLSGASLLAAQLGPLVPVPGWARMPSSLQRHWIKYSIAAGLGVSAGAFLYRHSRLAGSRDLDDWAAAALAGVTGAWADHVVSPFLQLKSELFRTYRERPSIVSSAEFDADRQALLRMLEAFQQDHPAAAAAAAAATTANATTSTGISSAAVPLSELVDADAVNRGMQAVMQRYETDLQWPLRNLLVGELGRTLLIQVQRMKLDGLAAMLEMDQILRANELSISLVAAVPALLVSWALLRGLWVMMSPSPPDPVREALPCRMAIGQLERALAVLQQQEQAGPGTSPAAAAAAEGMVLFQVFQVLREAQAVYRLKDRSSRFSEWPHLKSDLLGLARPQDSAAAKLDLLQRMQRMYTLLQP